MLFDHPFIVNNLSLLYGTHDPPCSHYCQVLANPSHDDINPFGSTEWISTCFQVHHQRPNAAHIHHTSLVLKILNLVSGLPVNRQ